MPCTTPERCHELGGICAQQCCHGCNCITKEGAYIAFWTQPPQGPPRAYVDTDGKVAIALPLFVMWNMLCSTTPLAELSVCPPVPLWEGREEREVTHWGSALEVEAELATTGIGFPRPAATVYVDGNAVLELTPANPRGVTRVAAGSGPHPVRRKVTVSVRGSGCAAVKIRAADCPQELPVDIEVLAGGRVVQGASLLLEPPKPGLPLPSLPGMPGQGGLLPLYSITLKTDVKAPRYTVKIYSGIRPAPPACRDLINTVDVELPGIPVTPRLSIASVRVNGREVPRGGEFRGVPPFALEVDVRSDADAAVDVIAEELGVKQALATGVVLRAGETKTVKAFLKDATPGRHEIKIYAATADAKSEPYAIALVVERGLECPAGTQLVRTDACRDGKACIKNYGELCCCEDRAASPRFRLGVPGTIRAVRGERVTLHVDVRNEGQAFGTATVEIAGRLLQARKSVGVWPGSTASVDFEFVATESDELRVRALYGNELHDEKVVRVEVAAAAQIDFDVSYPRQVRSGEPVAVQFTVRYPERARARIMVLDSQMREVAGTEIDVPGSGTVTFLAGNPGTYTMYAAVRIGMQFSSKQIAIEVTERPPRLLIVSGPVIEVKPPCASSGSTTLAAVKYTVMNDGGRGACTVETLAVTDGYTAARAAEEVALGRYERRDIAHVLQLVCGREYAVIARAVCGGSVTDERRTPLALVPGGAGPCTLDVRAALADGRVRVFVSGHAGRAVLLASRPGGVPVRVEYREGIELALEPGTWVIEAYDERGCYGSTLVAVPGATPPTVPTETFTVPTGTYTVPTGTYTAPTGTQVQPSPTAETALDRALRVVVAVLPLFVLLSVIRMFRR